MIRHKHVFKALAAMLLANGCGELNQPVDEISSSSGTTETYSSSSEFPTFPSSPTPSSSSLGTTSSSLGGTSSSLEPTSSSLTPSSSSLPTSSSLNPTSSSLSPSSSSFPPAPFQMVTDSAIFVNENCRKYCDTLGVGEYWTQGGVWPTQGVKEKFVLNQDTINTTFFGAKQYSPCNPKDGINVKGVFTTVMFPQALCDEYNKENGL